MTCRAPRRVLTLATLATFAVLVSACDLVRSSPVPSTEPAVLGLDWGRATSVERPVNYEATLPPGDKRMHPILRIPGQAYMVDLTPSAGGGFVAVGYIPPSWTAAAWTSPDGSTWSLHLIDPTEFSFAVAVATGTDGRLVAVGRSGPLPVAWTSSDGTAWQRHAVPTIGSAGIAERMTTIVTGASGFVAGGSAGPELADRSARFWTSADGSTWVAAPAIDAAFANAEVRSITRFQGGYVAVGVVGTVQAPTGAVAWTSPDGVRWTRVDDPAFVGGAAVSVTVTPSGGLVAVGSDRDRHNAVAWTSRDGRRWARAPDEASRQHSGGFAWMTDVTAVGDELIAVGDVQGLQRGTAVSWISSDGLTWEQSRSAPVQEGAEFYGVIPGGPGAIAIGAFGTPDSYVPEVWLTPAR
ncbi:MAG TPA: hypothetical protein VF494_11065 [Candidatus Limnocylindrales bacterium]